MLLFFALSVSSSDNPDDRIRHLECFDIVRGVEHALQGGKKEPDMLGPLRDHCATLPDSRKNICTTIITIHLRGIIDLLQEKKRPDFVCDFLGYPRRFGTNRIIPNDNCVRIVEALRNESSYDNGRPEPPPLPLPPRGLPDPRPPINPEDQDPRPFGLHRPAIDRLPRPSFLERHFFHGPKVCREIEVCV
jgi:hypothetical protein